MRASQPCELCGCTEVNLHDGFYFCTECGTQDKNLQETIIEYVDAVVGDGILHGAKKKIRTVVQEERQMSDAWYKWHAFNFLLKGTADELLQFGAKPSFKTKLMWVWVRYIKKYLNTAHMGLSDKPQHHIVSEDEEEIDSDVDQPPEDLLTEMDARRDKTIKSFSFTLFVTLLFIALNLDKSDITLTHLIKVFRDGLISVPYKIENLIPKELKPEKLNRSIKKAFAGFKPPIIRVIAMTLFKRLDLGNPIVPDLRLIVDNHFKELCLPNDMKPLVLSLMHYKPCNFLDVNAKDKVIYKVPAYEFHIMTYIIWALKICLGLDCMYEVRLSKAAEAVNEVEDRPKSFNINGESAPTNRLFSFREWMTFYQFKKNLLRYYCHRYANRCSWDTDDYIAYEQYMDGLVERKYKKDIKDEMVQNLLNRIKGGEKRTLVIPRSEFKPTLTPFHSYTQVLVQHLQDPEVKEKLTEDFTQYSLKYAFEDWNLVNPNSRKQKNVVKGIRMGKKEETNKGFRFVIWRIYDKEMVYVRNCDNHNWLTTKPPTLEHVVKVDRLKASDEGRGNSQSDIEEPIDNVPLKKRRILNKVNSKSRSISEISFTNSSISNSKNIFESNKLDKNEKCKLRKWNDSIASNNKFPDTVSEYSFTNSTITNSIQFLDETKVFESSKLDETEKNKLREIHDEMMNPNVIKDEMMNPNVIKEETEGENIFDDDFKSEIKEELEELCDMDYHSDTFQDVSNGKNLTEYGNDDNGSVVSSVDSVVFNETAFDRAKVIKEIILYTCKKHKLPIPPEYNARTIEKKLQNEMGTFSQYVQRKNREKKKYNKNPREWLERRKIVNVHLADYHEVVKDDILNQVAQKVNMAVQNAESALEVTETPPLDTVSIEDTNADASMDVASIQATNEKDQNQVTEKRNKTRDESDEDKLFSEESEGETYAKDLLPEKNPDYDEEVYDASQLYLKAAKVTDPGEMELDPQLPHIIDKKILKDSRDPSLLTWTEERKKISRPDSEDEMPLSVLQELMDLTKRLSKQDNEYLDPLLNKPVENIQYWFKFYAITPQAGKTTRIFEKELLHNLPTSLTFLLKQCSHILGVSEAVLYTNLQRFETTSLEKSGIDINAKCKMPKGKGYYNY